MTVPSSRQAPADGLRKSLRRADFLRVTGRGRRIQTRYFLLFRLERGDGAAARLGITVTRKIGNAVRRNRIKRLVREWFRARQEELESCDLVVIATREMPARPQLEQLGMDLDGGLSRATSSPDC